MSEAAAAGRTGRCWQGLAVVLVAILVAGCGTRVHEDASAARAAGFGGGGAGPGSPAATSAGAAGTPATTPGAAGTADTTPGAVAGQPGPQAEPSPADPAAQGAATCAEDTSPIKIGAVSTTSGLVGANGAGQVAGLQAWVQDVNARGGIMCRQVDLTIVDDGADPARHSSLKRQLYQDHGVTAIVGEYAPLTSQAGMQVSEQFGIPQIGGLSANPADFSSPISFPFQGSALPESTALGRYRTIGNGSKVAIYYVSEVDFGVIAADTFQRSWEANGGQTVVRASISLAQPDFTAEVARAQAAGADTVYLASEISGCNRFWDAARRQNYKPMVVTNSSCYNIALRDSADVAANRYVSVSTFEPPTSDTPAMQAMVAAVKQYQPQLEDPRNDGTVMRGWASGKLFEVAVAQAGGRTDPQSLIGAMHALRGVTLDGLIPPLDWPEGPHPERLCAKLVMFDGQDYNSITPEFLC
ncbi:MAG: branched-chain amino acid transport system substrate-binding protein [Acidimicrobiaceae bacterium]|jgi:branched-chain amino acid transport system substrate-binding protein